ncbi:helix-turn-helix transcriptional regulator [Salinicoccus bachuensis]|uniref:Helix-turn-helix transcriptional regulator n=1 Tax=Salinicoccus bachuensis TaxID=3136731 RepID=A0ABZ3CHI5_9STAP
MSRMDEIKARAIAKNPERRKTFDQESKRLKTAVMVVNLRDEHDLSQQALADKVGVSKSTIARIENAQVDTSVEMLNRIARAVDKELKMSIV